MFVDGKCVNNLSVYFPITTIYHVVNDGNEEEQIS